MIPKTVPLILFVGLGSRLFIQDATDAAKNAAAMILTTEGLSAVFGAVVESRKIFARLFSYVSYRLAATIQILLYLSSLG